MPKSSAESVCHWLQAMALCLTEASILPLSCSLPCLCLSLLCFTTVLDAPSSPSPETQTTQFEIPFPSLVSTCAQWGGLSGKSSEQRLLPCRPGTVQSCAGTMKSQVANQSPEREGKGRALVDGPWRNRPGDSAEHGGSAARDLAWLRWKP